MNCLPAACIGCSEANKWQKESSTSRGQITVMLCALWGSRGLRNWVKTADGYLFILNCQELTVPVQMNDVYCSQQDVFVVQAVDLCVEGTSRLTKTAV